GLTRPRRERFPEEPRRFAVIAKEHEMQSSKTHPLAHRMHRRAFVGAASAAIAAPVFLRGARPAAAATQIDFTVWNYAVDIIQDNINLFQAQYPDVTVKLSDFGWPVFHETMVNRFISKTPT